LIGTGDSLTVDCWTERIGGYGVWEIVQNQERTA